MGYVLSSEKEADIIIILACSVKQTGVDRIYGNVKNWNKLPQKPKIVISACVLESDKKKLADRVYAIVDSKDIVKWIKKNIAKIPTNLNNNVIAEQCNNNLLSKGESNDTAYIPIMQGCDNFCTYCAVPYTRGREVSRLEKEILKEIKEQLNKGFNKILLLGQNVNSYGKKLRAQNLPIGQTGLELKIIANNYVTNATEESQIYNFRDPSQKLRMTPKLPFARLLEKIDSLPGNFSYNFMSSNPHDFTDDLINTLSKLKKWEKVLHLPMQSGDDEILKNMNRKYDSKKYLSLIKNLKLKIKNLSVTTDIIIGFPSETEEQFNNTVNICKKIDFSKAFISQYSPRPNTVSAMTMIDDVPKDEKKRRWDILNNLINKKSTK
jgi:tRNA-2-methylthio-N6-dimethylallyladenosine synthase